MMHVLPYALIFLSAKAASERSTVTAGRGKCCQRFFESCLPQATSRLTARQERWFIARST